MYHKSNPTTSLRKDYSKIKEKLGRTFGHKGFNSGEELKKGKRIRCSYDEGYEKLKKKKEGQY